MSANKYQPHVLILPEDDANRQLANGFVLHPSISTRKIQILSTADGWTKVLDKFEDEHFMEMDHRLERRMILLIDFDCDAGRMDYARSKIPESLKDRVFVLGVWSEPERLRKDLGSYEEIGKKLATDCWGNTDTTWNHDLLRHNAEELARLRKEILPILFE